MKKERHLRKRKAEAPTVLSDGPPTAPTALEVRALQKRREQKTRPLDLGRVDGKTEQDTSETKDVLDAYVKETSLKTTAQSEDMDRYIEYHMKQRLGTAEAKQSRYLTADERRDQELFEVPDNLKSSGPREVNIPGLMTGISEVRLPTLSRLKNIEETEEAKAAILETGSLERTKPKKRRTQEQEEEEATGIKRSAFVSSFGRIRRR